MEQILDLYERAYDVQRPLVCFDEHPCQLLDDVLTPVPMTSGKRNVKIITTNEMVSVRFLLPLSH